MNTETQYLEEFDDKKFALIQNELIKILSKTPNTYIEQSHLYEKLFKASLNDSPNMKYIFIMVLRNLPIISENIFIKKENNIFSGIFSHKKDVTDNLIFLPILEKTTIKDFIDLELPETNFNSEQNLSGFDETDDENSNSARPRRDCSDAGPVESGSTKEWMIPSFEKKNNIVFRKLQTVDPNLKQALLGSAEDLSFPTETQVIQFIVDNDIKSFLFRKDYQGNTILHSLIIDCDAKRIKNLLKTNFYSFLERNNDGKTPLDLITDVNVSNVIHTILYQDLEYYSYKVNNLQMFIEKIDILFKYTLLSIIMGCLALLILVIYF